MTATIFAANRAANHDTTNRTATAYTTASISFVAGRTYMLAVRGRSAADSPSIGSVAGGGNTWTLLQTVTVSNIKLWLYYCVAASTTADTITVTPDGVTTWTQAGWIVDEFASVAPTPIVQSAQNSEPASHSSLTVTLSLFADARNATYGVFAQNEDSELTPGEFFTPLGAHTEASENANRIKSIWKSGEDTSVDITTATTTSDVLGIAVEIAIATVPPAPPELARNGKRLNKEFAKAAVSGAYGPVIDRFRFFAGALFVSDFRTDYNPLALVDITEMVTSYSIAFDADARKRTASIKLDTTLLAEGSRSLDAVSPSSDVTYVLTRQANQLGFFIAHEVYIGGYWYRWPVGWFLCSSMKMSQPAMIFDNVNLQEQIALPSSIQLSDIAEYFDHNVVTSPYTIAAGTRYIDAIATAIAASGFNRFSDQNITNDPTISLKRLLLGANSLTLAAPLTINAGQTWASVINPLLAGMNYYESLWTTADGDLTSGKRVRPALLPVRDWFGARLKDGGNFDGLYFIDAGISPNVEWEYPQQELWNQVVASSSNLGAVSAFKVSQIDDSAGLYSPLISRLTLGRWITKNVSVENVASAAVLQQIADWYIDYANFHSIQVSFEAPVEFFNDRVITPYIHTFGKLRETNDFGRGGMVQYIDLGYSVSSDSGRMRRRYGTGIDMYSTVNINPATPSAT